MYAMTCKSMNFQIIYLLKCLRKKCILRILIITSLFVANQSARKGSLDYSPLKPLAPWHYAGVMLNSGVIIFTILSISGCNSNGAESASQPSQRSARRLARLAPRSAVLHIAQGWLRRRASVAVQR